MFTLTGASKGKHRLWCQLLCMIGVRTGQRHRQSKGHLRFLQPTEPEKPTRLGLGSRTISKTPVRLHLANLRLRLPYRLQQWVHQLQAFKKEVYSILSLNHRCYIFNLKGRIQEAIYTIYIKFIKCKLQVQHLRLPPTQLLARKQPQLFSLPFDQVTGGFPELLCKFSRECFQATLV